MLLTSFSLESRKMVLRYLLGHLWLHLRNTYYHCFRKPLRSDSDFVRHYSMRAHERLVAFFHKIQYTMFLWVVNAKYYLPCLLNGSGKLLAWSLRADAVYNAGVVHVLAGYHHRDVDQPAHPQKLSQSAGLPCWPERNHVDAIPSVTNADLGDAENVSSSRIIVCCTFALTLCESQVIAQTNSA